MHFTHALIVDDSRTSATLLGKMLARSELSSDKVDSGEACLTYLADSSPDIIFMDHMMPGMDGFEAVKAIKKQPQLATIPIVMYTSKGGEMYDGQARALGAVGVLQKPATEKDVVDLLQRLDEPGELVDAQRVMAEASNDPMYPGPKRNTASLAIGEGPNLPGWASGKQDVANDCRAVQPQLKDALVVDDSRTSATLLAKMLGRHDLNADKVDSGEACLAYLEEHRPDIIFMDHMMPGMDGFEAVKAIKKQSRLAAIPIVMYTSKGGEMYIGQARALGAVGVLEKPAAEEALVALIDELQPTSYSQPETVEPAVVVEPIVELIEKLDIEEPLAKAPIEEEPANEEPLVVPETTAELPASQQQRPELATGFALPSLESQMRNRHAAAKSSRRRLFLAALFGLLILAATLWASSRDDGMQNRQSLFESLNQLGNQHQQYPFNGIPFDDARFEVLQELVRVLHLSGIGAEIELRAHVGEFCRVYADSGQAVLPGTALHIEQCDMIGYEPGEAQALAGSQSLKFRRFVEKVNGDGGNIKINLVPVGIFEPLAPYPPGTEVTTAADWNRVAKRNQRVELLVRPEPVSP